jgi:hypothetical protein
MSIIGNNSDTLLHTLSDFWLRYFRDIKDIQALYEGTEILLGQTYLNLLSDVLNTSLVETPLFQKEYFKLLTIREDQLVFRDTGNALEARYVFQPNGDPIVRIPQLQNTIFNPTAALEEGLDYSLADGTIQFFTNPTAPVPPGYAYRDVEVPVAGTFECSAVADWLAAGVRNGDRLVASPRDNVTVSGAVSANTYTIQHVTAGKLYISSSTPIPGIIEAGYSWKIERTLVDGSPKVGLPSSATTNGIFRADKVLRELELSLWAVDVQVDTRALYKTYGHLFSDKRVSSEAYRAFLRGVMQLYVLGPAIDRIESALNVVANFAVVQDDDEILMGYDSGVVADGLDGQISIPDTFTSATASFGATDIGGYIEIKTATNAANLGVHQIITVIDAHTVKLTSTATLVAETGLSWELSPTNLQTVTTDRNTYSYPRKVPMREDVVDSANIGGLTFRAFETLTRAVVVTDYIKDPKWWHNIVIPQAMLPDAPPDRRAVTPSLFPNSIGPAGNANIGDAGFYIGADEYGQVVPSPFRHMAAFILMDTFLKMHTFVVKIDPSVDVSGVLIADMQSMLKELKPAHSQIYFQPLTSFQDIVSVVEAFAIKARLLLNDQLVEIDNKYRIGSTFPIGYGFKYSASFGGTYTTGLTADYTKLVIGGQDPSVLTEPADTNYIDRPLYVYMHP